MARMDLTTWVAVSGAIVSTTVAGWSIYRSVTDRGRLRVEVYTAEHIVPGVGVVKKDRLAYKPTWADKPFGSGRSVGATGTRSFSSSAAKNFHARGSVSPVQALRYTSRAVKGVGSRPRATLRARRAAATGSSLDARPLVLEGDCTRARFLAASDVAEGDHRRGRRLPSA